RFSQNALAIRDQPNQKRDEVFPFVGAEGQGTGRLSYDAAQHGQSLGQTSGAQDLEEILGVANADLRFFRLHLRDALLFSPRRLREALLPWSGLIRRRRWARKGWRSRGKARPGRYR